MSNLHTLRRLLVEVRRANYSGKLTDSLVVKYIMSQFRKYKTTDQQLCKAREEMKYMTDTYLCYLLSVRKYNEINRNFQGKGERSVEDTANMVGFKLPHDPK